MSDDIQFNKISVDRMSDEEVVRVFTRSLNVSVLRSLLRSAARSTVAFSALRSAARSVMRSPGRA